MSDVQQFQPVEGETIPTSTKKSIIVILLALVLIPFGGVLAWLWWSEATIPVIDRQLKTWVGVVGIGMALLGIVCAPLVLWRLLFRKARLVFGKEYLQIVVSKGGVDVVRSQFAYRNIASVSIGTEMETKVLALDFHDVDAADLVPMKPDEYRKCKKSFGFHQSIHDDYQISLDDLRAKIATAAGL